MKRQHIILTIALTATIFFLASCASSRVQGNDPVNRSISVTNLIIDGKTKDSYLEIYLDEISKANSIINLAIEEANQNPEAYLKIADQVNLWITLNNNLRILSDRYPNGLDGKKLHANFKYTDYQALKTQSGDYASDAYYDKALKLYTNESLTAQARRPAIGYFEKATNYSSKHDADIFPMAAELCYLIATEESTSEDITILEDASLMYKQAEKWIPGYKDSLLQIAKLNQKIANTYISKGNLYFNQKNYSAFRSALENYNAAEQYVGGCALQQILATKNALTIKVAYLFGGNSYSYPDDYKIVSLLQEQLASNTRGPAYLKMDFIHTENALDMLLTKFDDYDLVFLPSADFGQVKEIYGAANSTSKVVSKTVSNTVYSGSVVIQKQDVTVYRLNSYTLYDMRSNVHHLIKTWEWKQGEETKNFEYRQYFGLEEAKPTDFNEGTLYTPGDYTKYFTDFNNKPPLYNVISTSYLTLNDNGKQFADILEDLNY
jgi:hypothetical protein